MYKDGKWARSILESRDVNRLWGDFHSLSVPSKNQISTEQALRRLEVLGFTIEDDVISKAVDYMNDCILRKKVMPDRREKSHNWDLFSDLMFASWIRRFTKNIPSANEVASKWSSIISEAFYSGTLSYDSYVKTFKKVFGEPIKGGRFIDFVNFYHVSLLPNLLSSDIENAFIEYVMNNKEGIYYVNNKSLKILPEVFESKETTKFLAAIQLISKYKISNRYLDLVFKWLNQNRLDTNKWDLGGKSKDSIYLPLSDSWRSKNQRIEDCSYWINNIVEEGEQ